MPMGPTAGLLLRGRFRTSLFFWAVLGKATIGERHDKGCTFGGPFSVARDAHARSQLVRVIPRGSFAFYSLCCVFFFDIGHRKKIRQAELNKRHL